MNCGINKQMEGEYTHSVWQSVCVCGCVPCHLIFCRSVILADTAYVRVFISDVNDNKPVFAQRLYEVGVDENADVGLAVITVSATDEDEGMLDEAADSGGPKEISLMPLPRNKV